MKKLVALIFKERIMGTMDEAIILSINKEKIMDNLISKTFFHGDNLYCVIRENKYNKGIYICEEVETGEKLHLAALTILNKIA